MWMPGRGRVRARKIVHHSKFKTCTSSSPPTFSFNSSDSGLDTNSDLQTLQHNIHVLKGRFDYHPLNLGSLIATRKPKIKTEFTAFQLALQELQINHEVNKYIHSNNGSVN